LETYTLAADQLVVFLDERGMPSAVHAIRREHVEAFIASVLANRSPATARQRHGSLLQLFHWLEEEGEIKASPMAKMKPPKVPEQPVPVLSEDQLRGLLATVKGQAFNEKRDNALLRVFIDTGARLAEIANLTVNDIDLDLKVLIVLGKGGRYRSVPFGNNTAQALDRYLRLRRRHRLAEVSELWLGKQGPLTRSGIFQLVRRRGRQAGIERLHPHQFRHTFAHAWLAAGGQEGDLQLIAGWSDRQMLSRYGASAASERAVDAHHRLALGDKL
jgi:site-specific recombinase XerD